MTNGVFKVALPGYDAEVDTDPDHFALYVDRETDYILIKEKTVDSIIVSSGGSQAIAHGLGYVPLCIVHAERISGEWKKIFGYPIDGAGLWFEVDTTNLTLHNDTGSSVDFAYHIFYDNITT
jgi:hypothetical protein